MEDGELRVLRGPPDLQTNLITSPAEWNHFASFGMAQLPERGEEEVGRGAGGSGRGGGGVLKLWRKFETCHINFSHRRYQGVGFSDERRRGIKRKEVEEGTKEKSRSQSAQ